VSLYFRFTLSLRDVEEILAERGIKVSYETVRCWAHKFGQSFARSLRRRRPSASSRWHPGEMTVKIGGRRMWLWRTVDDEGEVLDMLVQKRRNTNAGLRLLTKLLESQGLHPQAITTDRLASYRAACRKLGSSARHLAKSLLDNSRAKNSHLPIRRREREQQKLKTQGSAQRFLATHAGV